jgi:hypothetical protein
MKPTRDICENAHIVYIRHFLQSLVKKNVFFILGFKRNARNTQVEKKDTK